MGTGLQKFEKYLELRVLQKKFKKKKFKMTLEVLSNQKSTKCFFQNQEPNNTNINYEHMPIKNVTPLIP